MTGSFDDHRPSSKPGAIGADPASAQVDLILSSLDALPTLPAVATRLLALTSAEDADFRDVVRLIESDPPLTAKVLSLCARASLGVSQKVTTVERAVVLLGFEAVRSAVLSVQVSDWVQKVASAGGRRRDDVRPTGVVEAGGGGEQGRAGGFDGVGFWRHCIAVACAAEMIARRHRNLGVQPGDAFVAGLVHDMGKAALSIALPAAYGRVIEVAHRRRADLSEVERELLGLDHHTAGKRLAERWGLPETLRDTMWLHGQRFDLIPESTSVHLIGIVSAADGLCRRLHLGWSGNHAPWDATGANAALGLGGESIVDLAPELAEHLSERAESLGLAGEVKDRVLLHSVLTANRELGRLSETLQERGRASERRRRVLQEIETFQREHARAADLSVEQTGGAVVRSASRLLGPGLYAMIRQGGPGDESGWVLARYGPDGSPREAARIAAPTIDGRPAALEELLRGGISLPLAVWLGKNLSDAPRAEMIKVLALGRSAALVHDRDEAVGTIDAGALGRELPALQAAWTASLQAAAQHERTRALSEQLAGLNQSLALAQESLAKAQSMARLGELTAGAAHEMNNPLAVISGRAQSLEMQLTDTDQKAAAGTIVDASRRLTDLITRLHLIAAPPAPRFAPVSLQDLLALVVRDAKERTAVRSARAPMVGVRVVIEHPVPPVRLDRDLMRRALVEILANAMEAGTAAGGVEPVQIRVDAPPAHAGSDDAPLVIKVIDAGCGMDAHALEHAFDPFFSSKPAGRQSGLGLPTAQRLISLHSGEVSLTSTPGQGTTAMIVLPRWRWVEQIPASMPQKRAA